MAEAFNVQAADERLESHLRVIGQSVREVNGNVVALQKTASYIREQEDANRQKLSSIEDAQRAFQAQYGRDNEKLKNEIANLRGLVSQNAAQTAEIRAHVAAIEAAERQKQLELEKVTALSAYVEYQSSLFESLSDNAIRFLHTNYCLQRFAELNVPEAFGAHLADLDVATRIIKTFQEFIANADQATVGEAQRIFNACVDAQDIGDIARSIDGAVSSMHGNMQSMQQSITSLEAEVTRDEEQVTEFATPESRSDYRSRLRQSILWLLIWTCSGAVGAAIVRTDYPIQATAFAIAGLLLGLLSAYVRWTARRRKRAALPRQISRLHERIERLNRQDAARRNTDLESVTVLFRELQAYRPELASSETHSEQEMSTIAAGVLTEARQALAAIVEPHSEYIRIVPPSRQYVGALYHGRGEHR